MHPTQFLRHLYCGLMSRCIFPTGSVPRAYLSRASVSGERQGCLVPLPHSEHHNPTGTALSPAHTPPRSRSPAGHNLPYVAGVYGSPTLTCNLSPVTLSLATPVFISQPLFVCFFHYTFFTFQFTYIMHSFHLNLHSSPFLTQTLHQKTCRYSLVLSLIHPSPQSLVLHSPVSIQLHHRPSHIHAPILTVTRTYICKYTHHLPITTHCFFNSTHSHILKRPSPYYHFTSLTLLFHLR